MLILKYYKLHRKSLNRGKSYTDSPKWLKNKKATINPKNNVYIQYVGAVELNHEQINSHPEIISNIKPFIDQYDWKEIDFLSHRKDWKKFESSNKSIALHILHVP